MDLALNNLQRLICHKTQQTKPNEFQFLIIRKFYSNIFCMYTHSGTLIHAHTYIHTCMHTYIHISACICICVCYIPAKEKGAGFV